LISRARVLHKAARVAQLLIDQDAPRAMIKAFCLMNLERAGRASRPLVASAVKL
jgi:hypothetical protein